MTKEPWENWIPGILSKEQVSLLAKTGKITIQNEENIDYSSIDLTLSSEGYLLGEGAVKPCSENYINFLKINKLIEILKPDGNGYFTLEPQKTYLFKLNERINGLMSSNIYGQATAKSSVGRLDVLARLVIDGMDTYEYFNPKLDYSGSLDLYVEITPMTFRVIVKEGISLVQLRLFHSKPENSAISGEEEIYRTFIKSNDVKRNYLSVDLDPFKIDGIEVSGFSAKKQIEKPIKLWKSDDLPNPCNYWKGISLSKTEYIKLEKENFYILRSKEKLNIPKGIAVYCRALNETLGEMRVHYAGFVHPLFGSKKPSDSGTPLIFEVRGHDVDIILKNGEKIAELIFYRMSEDAVESNSEFLRPYDDQTLNLSKYMGNWPDKIVMDGEGNIS